MDAAYREAGVRFASILDELVAELALLRRPLGRTKPALEGPVARRMLGACWPHRARFVTPMAAVAGSPRVLLRRAVAARVDRAYRAGPGGFGLLWRGQDGPLGFVLGRSNGARAEVLSLGVAPAARQRGLARALMIAAIERVSQRGLRTLYLEVAEDNRRRAGPVPGPWVSLQVGRRASYYARPEARGRGCAHAAPGDTCQWNPVRRGAGPRTAF